MESEVQEEANGSNFEAAGTDPPFYTTLMIHFLITNISTRRFRKFLFSVKFSYLFNVVTENF
jgi:hypothetical protein